MATLLEAGQVQGIADFLSPVFIFIFIMVILYLLLAKGKFLGENKNFLWIIAFIVAFLFLFTPGLGNVVKVFTPWFALLTFLVLFVILFFMFLGAKEETILKEVVTTPTFVTFAVIAFIVLILVALGNAYGPVFAVNQQPGFWNAFKRAVFTPRTLGMFFLLVVAAYTIRFLSDVTKK